MNNVEPRRMKAIIVDFDKVREWRDKRRGAMKGHISPVVDRRRQRCSKCKAVIPEGEKIPICPACHHFVGEGFRL